MSAKAEWNFFRLTKYRCITCMVLVAGKFISVNANDIPKWMLFMGFMLLEQHLFFRRKTKLWYWNTYWMVNVFQSKSVIHRKKIRMKGEKVHRENHLMYAKEKRFLSKIRASSKKKESKTPVEKQTKVGWEWIMCMRQDNIHRRFYSSIAT